MEVIYNGWVYSIQDIDYTAGSPANVHGAPEDCYPEIGSEIDYEVVCISNDAGSGGYDDIVSREKLDLLVLMQYESEDE